MHPKLYNIILERVDYNILKNNSMIMTCCGSFFKKVEMKANEKGLEFLAVAIMACDDEVIPIEERIETIADDADLSEVYRTERHLLYVARTQARDRLLVSSPGLKFLMIQGYEMRSLTLIVSFPQIEVDDGDPLL